MTEPEKAARILRETRYLSLATVNPDGTPWISTIFTCYDKNLRFIWQSKKDARHTQNLLANPHVAINLYWVGPGEDNVDGLYIEAQAKEIKGIKSVLASLKVFATTLLRSKFLSKEGFKLFLAHPEDFLLDAPFRLYEAVPTKIHKFVPLENWKDKYVDGRIVLNTEEITPFLK